MTRLLDPASAAPAVDRCGPVLLPVRTRVAVRCALVAGWLSRRLHVGEGQIIGGRVALVIDPQCLRRLAAGRRVVLVTGTNGKSTTALMAARAMRAAGNRVATNGGGANMPDGLVAALVREPRASSAVLEVDEFYAADVATAVQPEVLVLLNVSRDQLDRAGEVVAVERRLAAAVTAAPGATVVANADDPLVVNAAAGGGRRVWVAGGAAWPADTALCPGCGTRLQRSRESWWCSCRRRPEPDLSVVDGLLCGPHGLSLPVQLALPGRMNRANAAMAVAACAVLDVTPAVALHAIAGMDEVDGRYATVSSRGRDVRLLLAKNPAGWQATLALLRDNSTAAVVVCVNARPSDGRDTSWLWDVPFEQLRGRQVVAAGERADDLAVRLDYAGVDHLLEPDPRRAVAACTPGPIDLAATYSAFRAVRTWSGHAHR